MNQIPRLQGEDNAVETLDLIHMNEAYPGDQTGSLYQRGSTGVETVRGLRLLCDSFLGLSTDEDSSAMTIANALDRSYSVKPSSSISGLNVFLPAEPRVRRWIDLAFTEAFALWPFIDRQMFDLRVQLLYEQVHHGKPWNDDDQLGLFHAVVALGQRHDPELNTHGSPSNDLAEASG